MIYIIGEINSDSYEKFAMDFEKELLKSPKAIEIELTSGGGDSDYALAFFSKIKETKAKVTITARGCCQSAATLILAAGDFRYATDETIFMVHETKLKLTGTATELEPALKAQRWDEEHWLRHLTLALKPSAEAYQVIRDIHKTTTYFDVHKALEINLINKRKRYK